MSNLSKALQSDLNETKRYSSVGDMIDDMDKEDKEERRKNPIAYYATRLWWKIESVYEAPFEWYRKCKWFIQRGSRGWSDRDVWSIDYFLCDIMPPMLQRLKETKHGIPNNIYVKHIEELAGTFFNDMSQAEIDRYDDEAMKLAEAEFGDILNSIMWTFELAKRINNDEIQMPFNGCEKLKSNGDWEFLTDEDMTMFYKGFDLLKEHFFSLWD